MNKELCPVCGGKLKRSSFEKLIGDTKVSLVNYICQDCGEEGDFFNENDIKVEKAVQKAQIQETKKILCIFEQQKRSFAGIERALSLPQRTLSKWKTGQTSPSASAVALLKFLNLFPWLIDIADHQFDTKYAHGVLFQYVNDAFSTIKIDQSFVGYNDKHDIGLAVAVFHQKQTIAVKPSLIDE